MKKLSMLLLFLTLCIVGCNLNKLDFDNIQNPPYKGLLAQPIGEAFYTLVDLLLDGDSTQDIQYDESQLIYLSLKVQDTLSLAKESTNEGMDLTIFTKQSFALPAISIESPLFETFESGSFLIEKPEIIFNFTNELHLPTAVGFTSFYGTKINSDGDTLRRELLIYNNFYDYATDGLIAISNPQIGATNAEITMITLDKSNSDLDEFLSWTPEMIYIEPFMVANPDLNDDEILDFSSGETSPDRAFNEDAMFYSGIEFNMPLTVVFEDLVVEIEIDSISIDLDLLERIDSLEFKIVTYNYLPFFGTLDVQFLSADSVVLFTINNATQIMAAPYLNASYQVESARTEEAFIPLSAAGIAALPNTETIKLLFTLNSSESGSLNYTPLLSTYYLDVKLSVLVQLNIDL
jgi:hypothetical protein